jgi:hypothetical protein
VHPEQAMMRRSGGEDRFGLADIPVNLFEAVQETR